jgi:hypothetical protein
MTRLFQTVLPFLVIGVLLSLLIRANPVQAQPSSVPIQQEERSNNFYPNLKPNLNVPIITSKITIDGDLGERAWQEAAVATNFSENYPREKRRPPIGIKAYMAYDAENVYVAYVIEDDPARIRAHMNDRDNIWQDDYAGMLLDTQGDGQVTYFIAANPLGIQGDTRSGNGEEDMSFDLIYDSAGKITETGYQVEMAIPFRSLRFPNTDVQEWRATFWITRPREDRSQYTWASIDRNDPCMACQFGTLSGMKGVKSGRNLEILPAITGSQAGSRNWGSPSSGFDNNRATAEPSLNVKYGISSNLTADVTLNPDFSQIESDAAQIDVNSAFALSFPERRAFFQEGADLFDTSINAVYTRSINDPIAAGKLSGRLGGWTFGYIGARDNTSPILMPLEESSRLVSGGKSVSNIFRARRSFKNSSFIAAMATDRRMDEGGSGSVVGIDGAVRLFTKYSVSWQALLSRTSEMTDAQLSSNNGLDNVTFDRGRHTVALDGEQYSGHALSSKVQRNGRNYGFDFGFDQLSPTFRTDNGFVTNNDARRFNAMNRYTFFTPNSSWINRLTLFAGVNRFWNFDNVRKDEALFAGFNLQMSRQTYVNVNAFASNELYAGREFTQLNRVNARMNSNFSQRMQIGFNTQFGNAIYRNPTDPKIGHMFNAGVQLTVRATDRMTVSSNLDFASLKNKQTQDFYYDGFIVRSRVNYQFTRKLLTRVIVQYNDFSERLEIDPLVTYRVSPFTVFHLGSSHRYEDFPAARDGQPMVFQQTNRQIFFKLQYLFRM